MGGWVWGPVSILRLTSTERNEAIRRWKKEKRKKCQTSESFLCTLRQPRVWLSETWGSSNSFSWIQTPKKMTRKEVGRCSGSVLASLAYSWSLEKFGRSNRMAFTRFDFSHWFSRQNMTMFVSMNEPLISSLRWIRYSSNEEKVSFGLQVWPPISLYYMLIHNMFRKDHNTTVLLLDTRLCVGNNSPRHDIDVCACARARSSLAWVRSATSNERLDLFAARRKS